MPADDNDKPMGVGRVWLLAHFALRHNTIGTSRQRQPPIEIAPTGN